MSSKIHWSQRTEQRRDWRRRSGWRLRSVCCQLVSAAPCWSSVTLQQENRSTKTASQGCEGPPLYTFLVFPDNLTISWQSVWLSSAVQLLLCGNARRVRGEDPAPLADLLVRGGERWGEWLQNLSHHPVRGNGLPLEHRRRAGGDRQRSAHQVRPVIVTGSIFLKGGLYAQVTKKNSI